MSHSTPGGVEGVRGEFRQHFAREGVVPHVEVRDVDNELVGVITPGQPCEEPPQRLDAVDGGGRDEATLS